MAKIRNTSGTNLEIPSLGRMAIKGQVIEIPDDAVEGFTHPGAPSELWAPYDDTAKKIHEDLAAAVEPAPAEEPTGPDYESRTVAELSAAAEARGLAKSGTKAELVDRLQQSDANTEEK